MCSKLRAAVFAARDCQEQLVEVPGKSEAEQLVEELQQLVEASGNSDAEQGEGSRKRQAERLCESRSSKEARLEAHPCFKREASISRSELRCLRRARTLKEHPNFEQIDHEVFDMVLDYLVSTEAGRRPVHYYSVAGMTKLMQETTSALVAAAGQ